MDISSVLNTDLGNLNDSTLIFWNDCLSMYNTSYIFLKFTCPIGKKTKTYFLIKTIKAFFSKPKIWLVKLKEGFRVSSLKTHSNCWSQTPVHDWKSVRKYNYFLLFNNAFMIRSMIILTVTLSSNFSAFGFKFKTGLHVTVHYLSLATCWGKWLLRMIPSACLFKNTHGIISNIN